MSIYTTFDQAITYNENDIKALFANAKGWEGKYRQIMLLGKQLPALADEYKQDTHLVKGCESQVWLHYQPKEHKDEQPKERMKEPKNRCYQFAADSDARIVKGLVIVILAAFNYKTAQQISDFDIEGYFAELDLLKHLSPSRSNGIHAIVQAIREI
ncbi:MAG: SufE family protein [Psychrosphaera sp.]|nr:SufE family protein [Psychrosphaera sp.]